MGCGSSAGVDNTSQSAPGYKGPIFVTVLYALLERDVLFLGTMDPYLKFVMGKQEWKTKVHKEGGKSPKWDTDNTFTFQKLLGHQDVVIAQAYSENTITSDILIGEGAFALTSMRKGNQKPKRIDFPIYYRGEQAGTITVEVKFSVDDSCLNLPEIKAPDTTGKLIVKPNFARLSKNVNLIFKMSPLVTIRFGNETMSTSAADDGGTDPKWKDTIVFSRDLDEDLLVVEVYNEALIGSNDFIGRGYLSITDVLGLTENVVKDFKLYFDGEESGDLNLTYTFKTAEPQKYVGESKKESKEQAAPQPQVRSEQPRPVQQQPVYQQQQLPPQLLSYQQAPVMQLPINGPVQNYVYPNGDSFTGDFFNNLKHGSGKLVFAYGGYYQGQFVNDLFHGVGVFVSGDTRYEGQFANGKKNGNGMQSWNNGQAYNGPWLDNNMHGQGEWTFPNGQKKSGIWQNGTRVRWMDDQTNSIQAGKTVTSGFTLNSPSGLFTMSFMPNGQLFVFNNQTRFPVFSANQFTRPIFPPFWLRFDETGELKLIDATGQPYWVSGNTFGFDPPFILALGDDGKLVIRDAQGRIKWYSP